MVITTAKRRHFVFREIPTPMTTSKIMNGLRFMLRKLINFGPLASTHPTAQYTSYSTLTPGSRTNGLRNMFGIRAIFKQSVTANIKSLNQLITFGQVPQENNPVYQKHHFGLTPGPESITTESEFRVFAVSKSFPDYLATKNRSNSLPLWPRQSCLLNPSTNKHDWSTLIPTRD